MDLESGRRFFLDPERSRWPNDVPGNPYPTPEMTPWGKIALHDPDI